MRLLAFDPGESCGWATFDIPANPAATPTYDLVDSGTADLEDVQWALAVGLEAMPAGWIAADRLDHDLVRAFDVPDHIAFEDFVIYPHKAQELIGDYVRTARLIGVIQFLANAAGVPYTARLAREHKHVAESAGAEVLFSTPLHENRHANDAIRLGVAHVLLRHFEAKKGA